MTTGNTTLLGLALPVDGELDGTWGDVVNASITSLLDVAVAGTTTLSADADVTLTTTVLAANQSRQAVILWTASNGATTRNITAPARSKPYIVINAGTGSIVLRGAGPTTGITIVSGDRCLAAWNGSDFVKVASLVSNLAQVTGTLAVANGGTGSTTSTGSGAVVLATSPTLTTPDLGTPSAAVLTNATGLPIATGVSGLGTGVATFLGTPTSANLLAAVTNETGTGALVFATSPTLVTPALGTPASGTLTNATGLPIATGVSGLGTGVATFLATPSSVNLRSALTDETGTGSAVFATSPTLSGPTFNDGYTEEVFAVSGTTPALSPANGSIQTWTLSANSTPTAGTWNAGQSITLMVEDGTAFTITWTSLAVTWATNGGSAPSLNPTGYTTIALWKVGSTIYGARVGDA